jgi:hypothetical protein
MARKKQTFPAFTDAMFPGNPGLARAMREFTRAVEERLSSLERAVQIGYSVSNNTKTRTLDVVAAGDTTVARVLGTLIEDLEARGNLA